MQDVVRNEVWGFGGVSEGQESNTHPTVPSKMQLPVCGCRRPSSSASFKTRMRNGEKEDGKRDEI